MQGIAQRTDRAAAYPIQTQMATVEPRWYAAYTCAQHEKRVAAELKRGDGTAKKPARFGGVCVAGDLVIAEPVAQPFFRQLFGLEVESPLDESPSAAVTSASSRSTRR